MVDQALRDELAVEVNFIARNYAPEGDAASLEAVATTLEANAHRFVVGAERLRLWSMLLRERALKLQDG